MALKIQASSDDKVAHAHTVKSFNPGQICVLDSGSWNTRVGFAGEVMPRSVFPTVVGQPRSQGVTMGTGMKECVIGHECVANRGILNTTSPIKDGIVQNWDDIERLWASTIFDDLCIQPDKTAFLVSESAIQPLTSKRAREKTAELFFEGFGAEGLYLAVGAVLSLYASGLTTGMVLDSGSDVTLSVPVHEGYTLTRQITQSHVAGADITKYLVQMLAEKGYSFTTPDEVDIASRIKETMCRMPEENSYASNTQDIFHLPDGTELKLGKERFSCAESLFDFGLKNGTSTPYKLITETEEEINSSVNEGASSLLFSSITQCESYLRPTLLNNIVMAGGSTLFEGAPERLFKDIYTLYREAHPTENAAEVVKEGAVKALPNRQLSAWTGGSMLGMLSMFPHLLIQQSEYTEEGPAIIHTKCF